MYSKLGGYTVKPRTERCEDYDLWFRFFAEGFHGANLQEPLYLVREDLNAVRRRTLRSRWQGFETAVVGFKTLGFPNRWLIELFMITLIKSLVPHRLMFAFRRVQAMSSKLGKKR